MKKLLLVLLSVSIISSVVFANVAERISPYRTGSPGLFYSHANELPGGAWAGALDKLVWHGWTGATAYWADFNGDGIDDKTLIQTLGTQWQLITSYSAPNGDISNTNLDVIVAEWWNNAVQNVVFGDLDGDGIDDNSIYSSGADIFAGGGVDNAMVWGSVLSNNVPGIGTLATNPFSGWNIFGDYILHEGFLGDMNGDGYTDRVIYDPATFNVFVDYSGPGAWGDSVIDQQTLVGGVAGDKLGVTDINGDGFDDLAIIRFDPAIHSDAYVIYGWYTDPITGILGSALPDVTTLAGSMSLGDEVLFARLDVIPEPATLAVLGLGALLIRRKK